MDAGGTTLPEAMRNSMAAAKRHPLFHTWNSMKRRCSDASRDDYPAYGGRGISVCERWKVFWNFVSDMGPKPSPEHTLDRINNDGNYEPGNVRWATIAEQVAHRRPSYFWKLRERRLGIPDGFRWCSSCNAARPITDFRFRSNSKYYQSPCVPCICKKKRQVYRAQAIATQDAGGPERHDA